MSAEHVEGATADARRARVAAAVRTWSKHLVDLGGRNTLLWHRDLPGGTLDITTAHPAGVAKLLAGHSVRLSELVREPNAYRDAARRAWAIRAKTVELTQERGISAGFLAVGMATWDVPTAYRRVPRAPVFLRRVTLRPVVADSDDLVVALGDQIEVNAVLLSYLESERSLAIDDRKLGNLAYGASGWDPHPAFDALTRVCEEEGIAGFRITPSLVLGTFSYAKMPMVTDLTAQGAGLADHDVIAALAGDLDAIDTVRATPPPRIGESLLDDERLVLDADSSQHAVIDAVCAGSHLVMKGPPGTGKSQTISNLIATLAARGQRVLFVAEKRAAIDAVVGRLERRGLDELVLDAHDGRPHRASLARSLVETLDRVAADDGSPGPAVDPRLVDRRDRLIDHRRCMHDERQPWGVTVDQAQTEILRLASLPHPPRSHVRLTGHELDAVTARRRDELLGELDEVVALGAWTQGEPDPWFGARVVGEDQTERTKALVVHLATEGIARHRERLDRLADQVGLTPPRTVIEADDQLELMSRVFATLETFRPQLFEAPVDDLVAATGSRAYRKENGVTLGHLDRRRLRGQARSLLRPGTPPSDLHGVLVRAAEQRRQWRAFSGLGSRPAAPIQVPEVQRAHERFREQLTWLETRLEGTAEGNDLTGADLDDLHDRLLRLADALDRLAVVPQVVSRLDRLRANGLGGVVDDFARRGLAPERVPEEFAFIWWSSVLAAIGERDNTYGAHDGPQLRRIEAEYADLDRAHIDSGVARVQRAVDAQVRRVVADLPDQADTVRVEADRTRGHLSLRELLTEAPELMTSVRPCWAMSPLVVASVVPPGMWFDVVIFDEASQVPPAQAISAISRANQVVVAGDPRQLPPTSFFITDAPDEDTTPEDLQVEGVQSVLDVLSTMLPTQELTWHYRSHDERLIAFSNAQIYRGGLVTFPGTETEGAVRLDVVSGRGDGETSVAEVDRVVEVVLDHARRRPEESLGVITLGLTHAQRVEDALRRALAGAPEVRGFFTDRSDEPFFIKPLDRVQGDERDVVVLSIGYGRRSDGQVPHRFGPLNREGGERRLNVAITRARRRMTVVSSFSGDELQMPRLRARGAQMLRDFLLYAASGGSARRAQVADDEAAADATQPAGEVEATEGGATHHDHGARKPTIVGGRRRLTASTGSVLERPLVPGPPQRPITPVVLDLARRLRDKGLVVHTGYGISAHPLDLAIEDPMRSGEMLVVVETDGPVYADTAGVRERDRLRIEQLRRLGWAHERVWSVDVFRDPARDVARILDTVRMASQQHSERRRRVAYDAARKAEDAVAEVLRKRQAAEEAAAAAAAVQGQSVAARAAEEHAAEAKAEAAEEHSVDEVQVAASARGGLDSGPVQDTLPIDQEPVGEGVQEALPMESRPDEDPDLDQKVRGA
ncbi:AAA domain-containing protein [Luteipulveratus sp. YIM 133132]|uniref:AAA domain-containing protein n=1 Tax=Luteipulveratus flavus TaxID=3031728 RepID=UPI0023AEC935|nr:AAA domain-containing protein [Luteipulveratus sp. YIM 133132]MDE9364234.1 AAA domain-containing protein [Luteipulveratus sp. YIM 133132]